MRKVKNRGEANFPNPAQLTESNMLCEDSAIRKRKIYMLIIKEFVY